VADHLATHFSLRRLNQVEFDERVAQAMNAKARRPAEPLPCCSR